MKKVNVLLGISILLCVTGLAVMAKDYTAIFSDLNDLRQEYIFKRNITGFLTFLIGLCGIATSTFQKLKKAWAQRAIFWLGTIIAVLTLVHSTFFPSSFQDYNKSAHKIDMTIRNITLLQNELNFAASPEEKAALENEIRQTIMDFYNSIEYEPITRLAGFSTALYAQVRQLAVPKWIDADRYSDNAGNMFFIGKAEHARLSEAKSLSRSRAKENALHFWEKELDELKIVKSQELAEYVVQYGEFETGHFESLADSTFRYSTLFKMQKSILPFAITFFEIDHQTKFSPERIEQIVNIKLPKMQKK